MIVSIFSKSMPSEEREKVADALLAIKSHANTLKNPLHRFGTDFGKPKFPKFIDENTRLCYLVNEDSWYTINLLELKMDFLSTDIQDWEMSDNYNESKFIVERLNFTNDPAERGVKLSTDYIASLREEDHFQNVLQVVERERKEMPNLRLKKRKFK